jgi:hypothetical protein
MSGWRRSDTANWLFLLCHPNSFKLRCCRFPMKGRSVPLPPVR